MFSFQHILLELLILKNKELDLCHFLPVKLFLRLQLFSSFVHFLFLFLLTCSIRMVGMDGKSRVSWRWDLFSIRIFGRRMVVESYLQFLLVYSNGVLSSRRRVRILSQHLIIHLIRTVIRRVSSSLEPSLEYYVQTTPFTPSRVALFQQNSIFKFHLHLFTISLWKQKLSEQMDNNLKHLQSHSDHSNPVSLDSRYPRKRNSPKIFSQESSSPTQYIKNSRLSRQRPRLAPQVSRSEQFINVHSDFKEVGSNQRSSVFTSKIMSREGDYSIRSYKEAGSDLLAKRSVQILIGLHKGINKAQYSKINRRKEELFHKNISPQIKDSPLGNFNRLEDISEEQLVQKYKQLILKNQSGVKSFNLINKLYQIQVMSSKQSVQVQKNALKVVPTNSYGCVRKNSQIQNKISKIIHKPAEIKVVKEMLAYHSEKTMGSGFYSNDQKTAQPQNQIVRTLVEEPKTEAKPLRSIRKQLEASMGQREKNQNVNKIAEARIKAHINSKINSRHKIDSTPTKSEPQVLYPPPKKVTASAYIVYEVLQNQLGKSNKRSEFQTIKRKNYSGKIHSSLNVKSSSQIASLTKIMTCIVVIETCQTLVINPKTEKYKIGCFQTLVGGTSAEIEIGDIYTIDQLLKGLMLPSGNDASLALARWTGNVLLLSDQQNNKKQQPIKIQGQAEVWALGNKFLRYRSQKLKPRRCYNRFLAQMNKKARLIGLQRTTYTNSHGLSNPHNKSCCIDQAVLCQYGMRNSYFRQTVSCKQYEALIDRQIVISPQRRVLRPLRKCNRDDPEQDNLEEDANGDQLWNRSDNDYQNDDEEEESELQSPPNTKAISVVKVEVEMSTRPIKWTNTHRLLHLKDCYLGLKTGVTTTAGPCLASYVKLGERNFVIIVLNCKRLIQRFEDTQILRKWLCKKQDLKTTSFPEVSDQ